MKITKDTTDEELFRPVARMKAEIATDAGDSAKTHDSDHFASLVNQLATAEGVLKVRWAYRNALQYGASKEECRAHVVRVALESPNDTYSGRRNDARRAMNEGVRTEATRLLDGDLR